MNDFLFWICRRVMPGGSRVAFVGAVALAAFLNFASTLQATPVTFVFEAVVDQVTGSTDGLVQVVPGDIIQGSFTYEPTPIGVRSKQLNDLSFNVNGLQLASDAYEITLENDTPFPVLGSFPPSGSSFPGLFDAASISCSLLLTSGTRCTPEQIPDATGWEWRPFVSFTGDFDVLDSNELSSDLNWNGFGNRDLRLTLENPSPDLGLSIQATIGPLTLVPEPSAAFLAIIGSGLALLSLGQRQITRG